MTEFTSYNYQSRGESYFSLSSNPNGGDKQYSDLEKKKFGGDITPEDFEEGRKKLAKFATKNNAKSEGTKVKVYKNSSKIEGFAEGKSSKQEKVSYYALKKLSQNEYDPANAKRERVSQPDKNFVFLKIEKTNEHYNFWLGATLSISSVGLLLLSSAARDYFFSKTKSSVEAFPTADTSIAFGGNNTYVSKTLREEMGMRFSKADHERNDYTIIADRFLEKFYEQLADPSREDLDTKKIRIVREYFESGFNDIATDTKTQDAYKDLLALFLVNNLEDLSLALSSDDKQLQLNKEILRHQGEMTKAYAGHQKGGEYVGGGVRLQQIQIGLCKRENVQPLEIEAIHAKLVKGEDCHEELIKRQFSVGEEKFRHEARDLAEKISKNFKDNGLPKEKNFAAYEKIYKDNKDVLLQDVKNFGKLYPGQPTGKICFSDVLVDANKDFLQSFRDAKIKEIQEKIEQGESPDKKFQHLELALSNGLQNDEIKMLFGQGSAFKEELLKACKGVVVDYVEEGNGDWETRYKVVKDCQFFEEIASEDAELFFTSAIHKAPTIAEKVQRYETLVNDWQFVNCVAGDKPGSHYSPEASKAKVASLLQNQLTNYLKDLKRDNQVRYASELRSLLITGFDQAVVAAVAKNLD